MENKSIRIPKIYDVQLELRFAFVNWVLIYSYLLIRSELLTSSRLGGVFFAFIFSFGGLSIARFIHSLAGDWFLSIANFPLGLLIGPMEKMLARFSQNRDLARAKHFRSLFKNQWDEFNKFAKALVMIDESLPRSIHQMQLLDENQITEFQFYLKNKGLNIWESELKGAFVYQCNIISVETFNQYFLDVAPNLKNDENLGNWIKAFVSTFKENKDYIENFAFLLREIKILEFEKINEASSFISSLIDLEIERIRSEKRMGNVQRILETGKIKKAMTMSDVDQLDGHQFESFLEHLLKDMGYIVKPTRQTGDQGADIIVEMFGIKSVVQAKCYSDSVGNKAVQEVVGAKAHYDCIKAIVITNRDFTKSAIELANSNDVELWGRDKLMELIKQHPQYNNLEEKKMVA